MTFDEELLSIYKPDFGRIVISVWKKPATCNIALYDAGTVVLDEDAEPGETLAEMKDRILTKARARKRSARDLLA